MRFLSGSNAGGPSRVPTARAILQWVYLGRVVVAGVVFLAAGVSVRWVDATVILSLAVALSLALVVSGSSAFYTHFLGRTPGQTFIYSQALFDLALVTTVVHQTGGSESDFPSLYILVIAVASVLLPLASSLLITGLASSLYIADIIWGNPTQLTVAVWLQLFVFVAVAVATGWLASRVRVVGQESEVLQQEVRRLRHEADDILRNIGSGVLTVARDGTLIYCNPTAEMMLGLSAAVYVGQPVMAVLAERAPELAVAIRAALDERRRAVRAEGMVITAERRFPIGMTTTILDAVDDDSLAVTAIFRDLSDQKRIDELNLRTERLEAVAELSASLAHEIKNPLASIRSSVEQLARSTQAGDDERFLGQLVVRESDRLSRLLNEFIDFARVRVTESRPVDLERVIESAVEVVRRHPDCRDTVRFETRGGDASIEGDEDLLHRVVANLVLNAVQAAVGPMTVSIEARPARERELPAGVTLEHPVMLRVSDDGPGIPLDLRDRLLDPFVTGRVGGSGLGLAIVQRAVLAHQGLVFVESTPGRGTTFTILLPSGAGRRVEAA